jgi:hypothetical protein
MLVFQFMAVLAAMLFSGAAIYVNLVEHPARMECGTAWLRPNLPQVTGGPQ